jgi:hypothetical protein
LEASKFMFFGYYEGNESREDGIGDTSSMRGGYEK